MYANRDRDSIIFREEIEGLAARYPERLEVIHRLDAEQGFLDRPSVLGYLRGWEESDFYICGPAPFMDVIEGTLVELGIHADHIHVERFVSPHDPDRVEPEPTGAAAVHAAPVDARVSIHLKGETREFDCPSGKTILEAARAAGIKTPSNCEDGYCSVPRQAHRGRGCGCASTTPSPRPSSSSAGCSRVRRGRRPRASPWTSTRRRAPRGPGARPYAASHAPDGGARAACPAIRGVVASARTSFPVPRRAHPLPRARGLH
ncbi:MAG: iron-sulfur cluster-binding domain-containing protein [Deltaproteobacteria bacterium]|nr:iron-sulfur cluster-binding domain-containing protein [Deltaproteobacteria bacterium]